MSKSARKKPDGVTAARSFRLEQEVMDRLQFVADDRTASTGVKHSRADAIRTLAKEEEERIRKREGRK